MSAYILLFFVLLYSSVSGIAQEMLAPINYNPVVKKGQTHMPVYKKTTALSLPFFEDFTNNTPWPDSSRWTDHEVYINNTMCVSPISRGVATFDGLSQYGVPYDTLFANALIDADSLTSQPIDLSIYQPSDSLYLSFFYQPQGNGFFPEPQDSLYVYMRKKNSEWEKEWGLDGKVLQPFQQAMVPITDTNLFHADFQFRFINKATMGISDNVWNVDYVRLAANRNMYDTMVNDIAFTSDPTFLLNDYTYMPYRQFIANAAAETATQYTDSIRNNYLYTPQQVNYGFTARESISNTPLFSGGTGSVNIFGGTTTPVTFPSYSNTVPLEGIEDKVVFENKYYLESPAGDSKANDTIVREQIFDNYVAYDDGTAEKSYYLNLSPTLPGIIAVEYHLNQPDTLRGLAIYFGRQIPLARYKYFSIVVYDKLAGISGASADNLLYQQDFYEPSYADVNNFWVYTFDKPLVLPAGTFYAGTIQPAQGGSDSLYIGLDVNRAGGNHAYYNVLQNWQSSQISGALMLRPLLGQAVAPTGVNEVATQENKWTIAPNPATDYIQVNYTPNRAAIFELSDIEGRVMQKGNTTSGANIDISQLSPGMYFIRLSINGAYASPQKIIKR